MSVARLENLESKIAFLERANSELSDELLHQQRVIEELRAALGALTARLETARSDDAPWTSQDERPPHY